MRAGLAERLVEKVAGRTGPDRRGFLRGTTLVGAALVANPWNYITRPASAYDAVCGSHNTCASGYSVFCCTINNGQNTCPPNSFVAGWWKADNAAYCGGAARYYVDCNAFRDGAWRCRCNTTTCDQRLVACNQFRYGQCNTQVPLSETGPVVCRLVSCTPPWQQYAGTCSTTSRTDNNTTTQSAPCVTGNPPVGNVESVTSTGNTVRVVGWALDADQPSASINVAVYQDGVGVGWFATSVARPDVNAAYRTTGNHGFDIRLTASDGDHTYTVYAINVGPGAAVNPVLASRRIRVTSGASPVGNLEALSATGRTVRLRGWALDVDRPAESINVALDVDGVAVGWFLADVARPDVNAAKRVTGRHGFDFDVQVASGVHRFDLYGINVGAPRPNPLLARRSLDVDPGAVPRGTVDSISSLGGQVRITGWAFDPDQPHTEIHVAVYEGASGVSWFPTGVARPDVNAALNIRGRHGFSVSFPASRGVHSYTVYGINVGGGAFNPALGTRAVSVGQDGGLGNLEHVSALGRTVRLRGWAFDTGSPADEIPVAVYLDGAGVSWFPTGERRPDVNQAYGVPGDHGFDLTFDATPGRHTVTVYAIVPGARPVIGTRAFTVEAP